jgi:acetyl-CoA acyltransferase
MHDPAAIVGVGMTPFARYPDESLASLGRTAIERALADAGLVADDVEMAFVANSMGAIVTGQVAVVGQVVLAASGIDGIPVYNVDNACAGSSSALNLAVHAVHAGAAETVLVLGVEKLFSTDRSVTYRALNGAVDAEWLATTDVDPERESVFVKKVYADRLDAYAQHAPLEPETLARIAVKNRAHAEHNEFAQYREPLTVEQVLASKPIAGPVTALMCAPIGDGAAAAIVTSAIRAARSERQPIWIRGSTVSMGSARRSDSTTVARVAASAYGQAKLGPADVRVAEVHDATAFGELHAYEELGLAVRGHAADLVAEGATTLGGRLPVNPSGGLESRGHPVAATGLAQAFELVTQLRGEAGPRQVDGADVAVAETAGGFVNGDSAAVAVHVLSNRRDG